MDSEYPSDWDSRRKQVYQRDEYTCQNCGVKGGQQGPADLHAHHIVPKAKGGTHKISNLVCVCAQCHSAIHNDDTAPTGVESSPRGSDQSKEAAGDDLVTVFRHFGHDFNLENPNRFRLFLLPFVTIPALDEAGQELHHKTHHGEFIPNNTKKKYSYSQDIIHHRISAHDPSPDDYVFNVFLDVFDHKTEETLESFRSYEATNDHPGSLRGFITDVGDLEGRKPENYTEFLQYSEELLKVTEDITEYWESILTITDGTVELSFDPSDKWERQNLIAEYETVQEEWFDSLKQLSAEVEHPTY